MRKQLHNSLRFLTSERGAWNEGFAINYFLFLLFKFNHLKNK
jgi:hypothetical protein